MTGYGITQYNSDGSYGYAPLQSSSTWLSLAYIRKYKLALLGGYMKNLGSSKEFVSIDDIYVRGSKNIDQMFRVSPSFSYSWNKLEAGIEYELTVVR